MKQRAAGILYFLTSMMGILASTYESHLGMIASYILFAGSILVFISNAKWSLWLPLIGSATLAFLVIPSGIRNVILYPNVFRDPETATLYVLLFGLIVCSLVTSIRGILRLFGVARIKGGWHSL
jgi:hypothetical protein